MIWRILAIPVLFWALGFAAFAMLMPGAADNRTTDAIVVLTGGPGRIQRGIELLRQGKARRMLVSGVDRRVRPHEFAREYGVPARMFSKQIDLGHESVDTRSNAAEASDWLKRNRFKSVRLVTTDWHMARARFDLQNALDEDIVIVADAVPSEPQMIPLLKEYNKYLLRRASALAGI